MSDTFILLSVVGGIMLVIILGGVFLWTDGQPKHEQVSILHGMLGCLIFIFIALVGLNQASRLLLIEIGVVFLLPWVIIAGAVGGSMIARCFNENRMTGTIIGVVSGLSCLLIPYFYGQYRVKPSELEIFVLFIVTLLPGGGLYLWMRKWKWLQPNLTKMDIQPNWEQPVDSTSDQIPSQQLEFASDKPVYEGWSVKNMLMNILIVALLVFEVFGIGIGTFLSIMSLLGCKRVTLFSLFHNPSVDVLIGCVCWLVIWLVARHTANPFALYGTGTHFYGHIPTSSGYIATKWVTIAFLPVLPVCSYEIYGSQESLRYFLDVHATSYWMRPLKGLEMSQVVRIGAIGYGTLTGLGMLLLVLLQAGC